MTTSSSFMKRIVRPIAIAWVVIGSGDLARLILKISFDVQLSRLTTSLITFTIAVFAAFVLFPKILKQPFETTRRSSYLRQLGFYLPKDAWKHILLGIVLAICTLAGMLIGSLLTGRYVFDRNTLNATQILFSINPGIWEEFFCRGVIMFLLLRETTSVKRAALLQIVLFGLSHIKGLDFWSYVDVISVMIMAVSFTYVAYKTRTLVAGIVFHFMHDALLFLVQVPQGEYLGIDEYIYFYLCLWLSVGIGVILISISIEKFGVRAEKELYWLPQTSLS